MKFVTQSGSLYEVDTKEKRIRRLNGTADPTPRQGKDGEWRIYTDILGPKVGEGCLIVWDIQTTPLLPGSPNDATPTTFTSNVKEILET